MKKVKRVRVRQRRPIEDVPFYKFEYKFDDLPLDPARPFILEQISTNWITRKRFGSFMDGVSWWKWSSHPRPNFGITWIWKTSHHVVLKCKPKSRKWTQPYECKNLCKNWLNFQPAGEFCKFNCLINENNFPIDSSTFFPGKFKQSKSDEFFHDFELYSAPHGNGEASTVGFQLPDIFQSTGYESGPNFAFAGTSKTDSWTKYDVSSSEKRVHEVTKNLSLIYKTKRMQVFHVMARTRAALRSKEFFRLYTGPSDSIINRKSPKTSKFRTRFHQKPKKPFSYQIEYEKLRGLRESEDELAKVQAYIDRMIARNIKKFEDEKKKHQENIVKTEYHYPTLQELVSGSILIEFTWTDSERDSFYISCLKKLVQ